DTNRQPPEKSPDTGSASSPCATPMPRQRRPRFRDQRVKPGSLVASEAYLLMFRYFRVHSFFRRGRRWTNLGSVLYGSPANGLKNRADRAITAAASRFQAGCGSCKLEEGH